MKRPYLTQHNRQLIHWNTFYGQKLLLHLEIQKFKRELSKLLPSWIFEKANHLEQ